jgi:putative ABC transport system permease protein
MVNRRVRDDSTLPIINNITMKYAPLVRAALWRKPVEAILTLLAVTAAFTLFGLMVGLSATYQVVVETARPDRIMVNQRFPDSSPDGMPIAMAGTLTHFAGVTAVGGMRAMDTYYRDRANPLTMIGVDAGMRAAWPELPLTPAQWDRLAVTPTGVYVTHAVAQRLHVKDGDALPLLPLNAAWTNGKPLDLSVLGVLDDDPQWDYREILANFRYIDSLLPPEHQGYVWAFRIAVRDPDHAVDIGRQIDRYFANSGAPTRSQPLKLRAQTSANFGLPIESIAWTVGAAGLFVVLLLVGNAIAESVDERIPELAVLTAIGYTRARLFGLVFAEALVPCLLGAVLGSALAPRLSAIPRSLIPPGFGGLPPTMFWSQELSYAIGFAVVLSMLACAAPLLKLRRLHVAAAIAGR